jgi:hypothetical protein
MSIRRGIKKIEHLIAGKDIILWGGYDGDTPPEKDGAIHVRINNHWLRQGGTGHVVYQNCADDTADWVKYPYEPAFVVLDRSGGKFRRDFEHCVRNKLPVYAFVREDQDASHWYCELNNFMNDVQRSQPTMGTMAIAHLLRYDIKSLSVYGVPFWANVPRKQWKLGACAHNPRVNALAVDWLAARDNRLTPSDSCKAAYVELIQGKASDPLPEWKESMDDNKDMKSREKIKERMGG